MGYFHTRGETPRHFQFDASGQYLLVANQDSDSIAVFHFNLSSGEIRYTGNEYGVPSPNFICSCPAHEDDDNKDEDREDHTRTELARRGRSKSLGDSDSETGATVPTSIVTSKETLQAQLERAQQQVESLRQALAQVEH